MFSCPTPSITAEQFDKRFAALEARAKRSESQLICTRRQMRVTWAVSALAALAALTVGWHKDAIAQGYGITLAQAATRIAALETKTQDMTRLIDPATGQPTVRFTGINVQVVNGSGTTKKAGNGTGNVIIGYNELRGDNSDTRTGSHTLIVGSFNSYSGAVGAVIGDTNSIGSSGACVIGGTLNTASGGFSSVFGGVSNTASGDYAAVSGGFVNVASGYGSGVFGGNSNAANANDATVSGGFGNTASAESASVSGGFGGKASADYSSVSGGVNNTAGGKYSNVSGGQYVRQANTNGFSAGGSFSATRPNEGTFHSP